MSLRPYRPWTIVLLVVVVLAAAPEDAAGQGSAGTAAPPVANVEARIMESPGRLLQAPSGTLPLGSFRLEMRLEEPRFDAAVRRVVTREWRIRAELQKDDVFFMARSATDHVEGWILNQSRRPEPYEKAAGTLQRSPRVLNLWGLSRAWSVALSVAAPGWTAAGQERIEGRSAEKYLVDSARVPAARRELLRHWNIPVSKGTVWVDTDTGALLKANLEYRQDFTSPDQRGTGKTLASADARVQLIVTKIGRVTVNAPKAETSEQRLALARRLLAEVERSPSASCPWRTPSRTRGCWGPATTPSMIWPRWTKTPKTATSDHRSLVTGDFNGDGTLEVAVVGTGRRHGPATSVIAWNSTLSAGAVRSMPFELLSGSIPTPSQ